MINLTWQKLAPYQLANGDIWWKHPGNPALIQAAAHGRRSDGSNAFYVVQLRSDASEETKTNAMKMAIKTVDAHLRCGCHMEEGGTLNPSEPTKHTFCADHDPDKQRAKAAE